MKEKIEALIEGGKATPGPPLGPKLGPLGVNVGKLIADINAATKDFAGMKVPVIIEIDTDIQPGVTLLVDKGKMARLVDNLLSNAIKYNRRRGEIFVRLRPGELLVQDTGIGMDEKQIGEVFKLYKRFDTSVGGFGIGLNIVAMIAQEYGFRIEIRSKIAKGSEVIVRWDV